MKFLSVPRLQTLNAVLQQQDLGDKLVHARVEAYSCKLAGSDKRTAKHITHLYEHTLSTTPLHRATSGETKHSNSNNEPIITPLGDLYDNSTKNLLISLITTMNASFTDYDFSNLRPDDFDRVTVAQLALDNINSLFVTAIETTNTMQGFRAEFWAAIDETIHLDQCEVFSYNPDADSDLNVGKLWTVNYFFFNRKLKKMVFITANAVSKLHLQNPLHSLRVQQQGSSTSMDEEYDEMDDEYALQYRHHRAAYDDEEDDEDAEDEYDDMDDECDDEDARTVIQPHGGAYVDVNLLDWDVQQLTSTSASNASNAQPAHKQRATHGAPLPSQSPSKVRKMIPSRTAQAKSSKFNAHALQAHTQAATQQTEASPKSKLPPVPLF